MKDIFFALLPLGGALIFLLSLVIIFFFCCIEKKEKHNQKTFIILASFFILASCSCYGYWGSVNKILDTAALKKIAITLKEINNPKLSQQDVFSSLKKLEGAIDYSCIALSQLGSIYNELGLFEQALTLFSKVLTREPNEKSYIAQWIYCHSLKNQGRLPPDVKEKAQNLVLTDPLQKNIINLLAIDDYFQGNYENAIKQWQQLLATDEELSSTRRASLEKAIHSAQQHLSS